MACIVKIKGKSYPKEEIEKYVASLLQDEGFKLSKTKTNSYAFFEQKTTSGVLRNEGIQREGELQGVERSNEPKITTEESGKKEEVKPTVVEEKTTVDEKVTETPVSEGKLTEKEPVMENISSQKRKDAKNEKIKTPIGYDEFELKSEDVTKGGKTESFEFTERFKDDDGGVSGVMPDNQFKLNQGNDRNGEPYPRVQIILDDADAFRYQDHIVNANGKKVYKNSEFRNSINEIAKRRRDKDSEVVLDFRKSEIENKKSFDNPKTKTNETTTSKDTEAKTETQAKGETEGLLTKPEAPTKDVPSILNQDVINLRNAKSNDEITNAILKATKSDNITDALNDAEGIIGKSLYKSIFYSDPKRFANELADAIEKIQLPKDIQDLAAGEVKQKSAREIATEKRKEAKARLDELKKPKESLGIAEDPKEKAERLYDYHKALVIEAKEYIKEGVKTVEEWMEQAGEKLNIAFQKAWDEAIGKEEFKKVEELGYDERTVDAALNQRQTVTKLVEGLGQEISPEYEYYQTISRKESLVIANDFFKENGLQRSINEINSKGGKLTNEQKQSLYFITRSKLDEVFKLTKEDAMREEIADFRDQIDNSILPKITDAAQFLNNTQVLFDLNPELKAWSYKNGITVKARDTASQVKIDNLIRDLNDVNKKHSEEVAKLVADKFYLQQKLNEKKSTPEKAKEKIQKAKQNRKDAIDEWRKSLKNRFSSSVTGLTEADIKVISKVANSYIQEGVANLEILTSKVYDTLKEAFGKELSDEMTSQIRDTASKQLAKEGEKVLSKNISKDIIKDIITDHFENPTEGKSLSDKFFELPNMDFEQSQAMADMVSNALRNITRNEKQKIIDKYTRLSREKVKAQETAGERLSGELMKLSSTGLIDHSKVQAAITDKYKMTHYDDKVFENIKKLGLDAKKFPVGSLARREAVSKQLRYFAAVTTEAGISRYYNAYYYANILTSFSIHLANNQSNAIMFLGRYVATIAKHGVTHPELIKEFSKVMGQYAKRAGIEAKISLKEGTAGYLGHVSEGNVSQQLMVKAEIERADKLSKTLHDQITWGFVKYVNSPNQLLNSSDALFHELQRGISLFNDTVTEVKKEGFKGKDLMPEVRKRIDFGTQKPQAEATATAEGFLKDGTKQEKTAWKRRVLELQESNIFTKEAKVNSYIDAATNTFKGHPMGSFSRPIAFWLHSLHKNSPNIATWVNPFVNIVGNLYDINVRYSPFGWFDMVRLKANEQNVITKRSKINPQYNFQKDMNARIIQATVGTIAAASLMGLTQVKNDDGTPLLEITGIGTGDYNLDKLKKQAEGYKPYSFRINGGKWISYRAFTPLFITMALVGNYNDMQKYGNINGVLNDFAKRMYKTPYNELTREQMASVDAAATMKDEQGNSMYGFSPGDIVLDNLSRFGFATLNVLADNAITNSVVNTGVRFSEMADNAGKGAAALVGSIVSASTLPSLFREGASAIRNTEMEKDNILEYYVRANSLYPFKSMIAKDAFGHEIKARESGLMNTIGFMTLGKTVGYYKPDPVWGFLSKENIKYQKPENPGLAESKYDEYLTDHGDIMYDYIKANEDRFKLMQRSDIADEISAKKGIITKALKIKYLPKIPIEDKQEDKTDIEEPIISDEMKDLIKIIPTDETK